MQMERNVCDVGAGFGIPGPPLIVLYLSLWTLKTSGCSIEY